MYLIGQHSPINVVGCYFEVTFLSQGIDQTIVGLLTHLVQEVGLGIVTQRQIESIETMKQLKQKGNLRIS
jgi:hypothetical protein